MKTQKLLQLYYCLVRSVVEYSCPVWQIAGPKDLNKLDRVQRKALTLCLDMPTTSGREALEVEAAVMPIDLRIEEIAVREIAKIQSKSVREPIRQQLAKYEEQDHQDTYITPMGKALNQAAEMEKEIGINIKLIEPEFTYRLGETSMTMTRPSYWNRLGSSKSRSEEQKQMCKVVVDELMLKSGQNQAVAFTDGSCLGNPGPCGAGAIIYTEDQRPATRLHRPVAERGSILLAELVAILMVLETCIIDHLYNTIEVLKIFSDSQSSVGLLTLNWTPNHYIDVIRDIKEYTDELNQKGMEVQILWTPGHADIQGNDEADILAKTAAEEAKSLPPENNIITLPDVKNGAHKSTMQKWQRRWEISETGRDLYEKAPLVKQTIFLDHPSKAHYKIRTQLRTGYVELNHYKHKLGQSTTDQCECGGKETPQHFLLECTMYEQHRETMLQKVTSDLGIRNINMATLLAQLDGEKADETRHKFQLIADFIDETGRFGQAEPPQPQS